MKIDGELIAIESQSVFLLTEDGLKEIPKERITHATVTRYEVHEGLLAVWTVLGFLSTISHGFYLVVTAPVWLITGTAATVGESREPELTYPPASWDEVRKYARFPQGLPNQLDAGSLKPKKPVP